MSEGHDYDVAIVGAGAVGAAIARELARFELRTILLDAGDVGGGSSRASTAILRTGFDARPGTREAALIARGHGLLSDYAAEAGIPLERTGALLVAWDEREADRLPGIEANARACGYERAALLSSEAIYEREPDLGPGAVAALEIPDEAIVCPWTVPLAFATQALLAGVVVARREPIVALAGGADGWRLSTSARTLTAGWLINAAGPEAGGLHGKAGFEGLESGLERQEFLVFDKLAGALVGHVVLPVPIAGHDPVLLARTVLRNVLVGPVGAPASGARDNGTTATGATRLLGHAQRLVPALAGYEVTAAYAGVTSTGAGGEYELTCDGDGRYIRASGTGSSGLTASMALAEWVRDALGGAGLELRERPGGLPGITMPPIGERQLRPYQDADRISADPAYGEIVCFCERVTRGELRDALASPLAPWDLDGLRRRTRGQAGRCQGFYCAARLGELLGEGA